MGVISRDHQLPAISAGLRVLKQAYDRAGRQGVQFGVQLIHNQHPAVQQCSEDGPGQVDDFIGACAFLPAGIEFDRGRRKALCIRCRMQGFEMNEYISK
ncbi:MAG: hypothetical protein NW241_22765 [Bacteroidia bacterium]|nr:hypothetical protein [Bacteroidia bacterium]